MSSYESYAEYYHDVTKYSPEGIAGNQHRLDFNQQPVPFKNYPNKKNIDLSYLLPLDRNPFSDRGIKAPGDFTDIEKSLASLSTLLFFSNGITAIIPFEDKPFYMRSSPSAGGLYPTEIYVISNGYPGLEDGVYNYQVINQSLTLIKEGNFWDKLKENTFNNPNIENSNLVVALSGVFFRSSWRYQDRAYRRICLDSGHIIGNLELVSFPCGFKANLIGGFIDNGVNEILELDEEEEQTLTLIALTKKSTEDLNSEKALPSKLDPRNMKTPEGIRLKELHKRSNIESFIKIPNIKIESAEEKIRFSPKLDFDENKIDFNWNKHLYTTILKRRSTRSFNGESISKEELCAVLDFAYSPELFNDILDHKPHYFDPSLIETFIAINSVDGLEEGCYFYSKNGRYLRQVRFKNFREDIYYLCLGQELGYKASAVIFHTTDLSKAVFKYGERAYRYLHLDAGHLGQRINLACVNLNIGVSGIGGFFDDKVNEVLGIPEHSAVVYITTIGIPAKTS